MYKKILIVDDAPFIREIIKGHLSKIDFVEEVLEAEDGEKAVESFKENMPDLVFMDIVMPNLSGIEATRQIRAFSSKTPIVGLSTLDGGDVVDRIIEAGATTFLRKPFSLEDLDKVMSGELEDLKNKG